MKHDKELLVDIFEAYYYQTINGKKELVFMSQNLTSSGISNTLSETEVRNGAGNGLFATLSGQKDATVKLSENVFSFEFISMMSGSNIVTGAGIGLTSPQIFRGEEITNKTVTLSETPRDGEELEVYVGETLLQETEGFTIEGKVVTIVGTVDGNVKVMPYKYDTAETSQTITVRTDEFPTGGELVLKSVVRDAKEKATAYIFFLFDNVKPNGSFEINTTSEKQPNDLAVEMKVMKNEKDELYRIVRVPIA